MKLDFTIDRLKRMALFARVVELGSMSAAARELDMTPRRSASNCANWRARPAWCCCIDPPAS
ncbi:hypothetical protein [Lysobacter gummosus]|uniref:hypothetical protein n=1 Tax=Lysobacter gummosus TaxID=262324 RepID=UPI00363C0085